MSKDLKKYPRRKLKPLNNTQLETEIKRLKLAVGGLTQRISALEGVDFNLQRVNV